MDIPIIKALTERCLYCEYFLVGSIVGITAILAREIIGFLLPADTAFFYGISVVLVYAGGGICTCIGHLKVTFSPIDSPHHAFIPERSFVLIWILGLEITTVLSLSLRYTLPLEFLAGSLKPSAAFAIAAVTASFLTYRLNAKFTYIASGQQDRPGRVAT